MEDFMVLPRAVRRADVAQLHLEYGAKRTGHDESDPLGKGKGGVAGLDFPGQG